MRAVILSALIAVAAAQQNIKDPINDFCRRHKQQTCVIDSKLYIDGGMVYYGGDKSNDSVAEQNTWLLWEDTSDVRNDLAFPIQHANLTKDATIPSVSGGVLWPDQANKLFYLFGGEYPTVDELQSRDTQGFTLWFYDTIYNTWNRSISDASQARINWPAYGAGAVSDGGVAYWYGGYLTESSDSSYRGDDFMLNNLISYDMKTKRWNNNTWDQTRRAEGTLQYIPASEGGMLVYFGGVETNKTGGSVTYSNMRQIHLFDLANSRWYTQTSTGDVPKARRGFCSGVVWAEDQSSYNIYLFGGIGADGAGLGDLYVLSLPSFQWTLIYPLPQWATFPGGRGWSSCDIFRGNQMLIIGGDFTNSSISDCDVPKIQGQHALVLGQENVEYGAWWHAPLDNITGYRVPDQLVKKIGGDASGHATAKSPVGGWDPEAKDLSVYLATSFLAASRTATRPIPTPSSSTSSTPSLSASRKSSSGAIAGGTIGGLAALASLIALVLFFLRRRKRTTSSLQAEKSTPSSIGSPSAPAMTHSPSTNTGTGAGSSPVSPGSGTLESAIMHPLPYSPPGSPPPPQTPWHGISSAHYRGAHSPPPYGLGVWGQGGMWYPPQGMGEGQMKGYATYEAPVELPSGNGGSMGGVELPGSEGRVDTEGEGGGEGVEIEAPRAVRRPGFI